MEILDSELPEGDEPRRRVQQLRLVVAEHGTDAVAWDSERPEDFAYLYDPEVLLIRPEREAEVRDALNATGELAGDVGDSELIESEFGELPLRRLRIPERTDRNPRRSQLAMDTIDAAQLPDDGRQPASLEHWVHLCAGGSGRLCPATEPSPALPQHAWPRPVHDSSIGDGVKVVVVDTGWHGGAGDPGTTTPWLAGVHGDPETIAPGQLLREYAGHGTFIAGIVRALARGADVNALRFPPGLSGGGALREVDMVVALLRALNESPDLINLSAGCTSRENRPLLSFEVFHEFFFSQVEKKCLLVAAAGNDGVPDPFWPASFEWAIGVGSLDHDGHMSSFSNYGNSADVYAVGANHVSAYPNGQFVCQEPPHEGEQRDFAHGVARWSGTSFAAPTVVGMIAAEMSLDGDVNAAWSRVQNRGVMRPAPAPMVSALLPPYS